jgi:predicted AlkP superfamily pyrophosphatase or phosphodiesterase
MFKKILFLSIYLISFNAFSQKSIERPKLVVGIVVDQMRQEFLLRFNEKFGAGGFKRLMNDGYMMRNAHYNYVPTNTGPGHASIYTGTTPRVHGVIGNNWYDRELGRSVNCVEDAAVSSVGGSSSFGTFSPNRLLSSTITDELRLFNQNRSKVISASLKNRGAILPGGHNPNGAYWFDEITNNFITSTWYMTELPDWVKQFNAKSYVKKYMEGKWETVFPVEEYTESTPDDNNYELIWKGRKKPTFPYDMKKLQKENEFISVFNLSPFGNDLLYNFAKEAIVSEQLGQDDVTDFLAISFSATDRIGHLFGPNSVEIEDTYIRLDKNIEELLLFLDEKVGKGEYTVFLTADHGVSDVARHMNDQKQPNWYVRKADLNKAYSSLNEEFGKGEWINYASNYQVYFNDSLIEARRVDKQVMLNFLSVELKKVKGISTTYMAKDVKNYNIPHNEETILSNGYNDSRSGDLMFSLEPGWVYESSYYFKYGSPHGTNYTFDTHVPMLFYGWGIKKGSSVKYHPIIDIAPTLSMLLNIKLPNSSTGSPIEELFEADD